LEAKLLAKIKLELAKALVGFVCTCHSGDYMGYLSIVDSKWSSSNERQEIGNINNGFDIGCLASKLQALLL
jgi:hypothetical protein